MLVAVYPMRPSPVLTAALLDAGFRPVPVADAAEVEERQPLEGWAALVVELASDPTRGLAVARRVAESLGVGVLVVADRTETARLAEEPAVSDFVLTPLDVAELQVRLVRLGALADEAGGDDVIRFKDLELNLATYQALVGGQPCDLTYMEYELLRFFVTNTGRAWSREQILSKVWGYDYFGGSRTVDVHVRRLRAKLGEERASWITTVRSVGYRFG
jgi:DNA-binding response OmpR family regulator